MSIVFTEEQLEQARSIPRKSMDTVVASATDTPVSYVLSTLTPERGGGFGHEYETSVNGKVFYHRDSVLHYIHRHMKEA